jgi:ribosomal protein S18 acetylase RimI-like enzyme
LLQSGDYAAVCALPQNEEELYYMFPRATYPLTPEQVEASLENRLEPTVVLQNGQIVAYANLYGHDGESCWLGNVIVAADYRGKGAARYLLDTMESVARHKLNVNRLKLVCHNTNTRALLFYTKQGYKPYDVSLRMKPSGETLAGILMEKMLE